MTKRAKGVSAEFQEILEVYRVAEQMARQRSNEYVTLEHVTAALIEQEEVQQLLGVFKANLDELRNKLQLYLDNPTLMPVQQRTVPNEPAPTTTVSDVINIVVAKGMFNPQRRASLADMVIGVLQQEDSYASLFLREAGLDALELKRYLSHGSPDSETRQQRQGEGADGAGAAPAINDRAEAIKLLEKYCVNLNDQATKDRIDPLIGREEEVYQVVQILARRTKNNAILVGESGVGKTAIAEGLALKIVRTEVPEVMKNATVWSLDMGMLVAGTRFRGDFEERIKQVLKALTFIENPILFIDEIHNIMGAGAGGAQGTMDAANLLKPALARGELHCIGSTDYESYRKHFEKDRALLRRFKKVDVNEPSIADAKRIMRGLKSYYEGFHSVVYTDAALDAAVDLSARYINNQFLPDKAIDVMDNAGSRQRIASAETRISLIDVPQVELEISKMARIPAQSVKDDEEEKLRNLTPNLQAKVFGQNDAIAILSDAVCLARAGLRDTEKPLGSYLFTGPTGVGKTEMAKTLAVTLDIPLTRFDMSEYMEKHSVARLIGAPPGYVGFNEGGAGAGLLTNAIDTAPHCVLLLDEVEKAHPDVYNILLQVMDHGKLTNSNGKPVTFRNVYLIMTTNAGANEMAKPALGFGNEERSGEDDEAIKRFFAPEFRNRLDAVCKFGRLRPEHMLLIVDKFLATVDGLTATKHVTLKVDGEGRSWLAKKGFDSLMGARPLAKIIQKHISVPLSRMMLFGDLKKGGTAVVRVVNGELTVTAEVENGQEQLSRNA